MGELYIILEADLNKYSLQAGMSKDKTKRITDSKGLFSKAEVLVKVALEPRHTSKPLDSVQEQLHSLLFIYNDSLGGIPICFSDVKFRSGTPYGRIMGEMPWVHVDVMTNIILFHLKTGQSITGQVNKVKYIIFIFPFNFIITLLNLYRSLVVIYQS